MTLFKTMPDIEEITFDDVIPFGKMQNLEIEDLKNGISRFGGYRKPDYFMAYFRSAEILIDNGVKNNTLDEIGIPAFYMQRHALELLLKRVISSLYEVAELRLYLNNEGYRPSKGQVHRVTNEHKLESLLSDLKVTCEGMKFISPPNELEKLVEHINKFEKSSVTWARYENSKNIEHVKEEILLPIIDLQKQLELVKLKIAFQSGSMEVENTVHFIEKETYENEIYNEWKFTFLTIEDPENEGSIGM